MIHVNCLFSHTFGCPNDHRPQTPVAPCHLLNCATPAPFGRTTAHTIRLILGRTISPLSFHDIPVVTYLPPLLYRFCATPALNGLNTLQPRLKIVNRPSVVLMDVRSPRWPVLILGLVLVLCFSQSRGPQFRMRGPNVEFIPPERIEIYETPPSPYNAPTSTSRTFLSTVPK